MHYLITLRSLEGERITGQAISTDAGTLARRELAARLAKQSSTDPRDCYVVESVHSGVNEGSGQVIDKYTLPGAES